MNIQVHGLFFRAKMSQNHSQRAIASHPTQFFRTLTHKCSTISIESNLHCQNAAPFVYIYNKRYDGITSIATKQYFSHHA